LQQHAFEDVDAAHGVAAHLATCAECRAEVARLQWGASLLRGNRAEDGDPTSACLDDDAVAALAAGAVSPEALAPLVQHLTACQTCRRRVASVARALADPAVRREVETVDARGNRRRAERRPFLVAGLAAAAVLLFAVLPRPGHDGTGGHRAPTITALSAPSPASPVGTVADAGRLRWAPVAGADRYRVTLFDAEGRVLYETQLADTAVAIPDSIALARGRIYLWKVEARTGWDRWAASDLVGFSIAPERPR
jgi:hypothetical protein